MHQCFTRRALTMSAALSVLAGAAEAQEASVSQSAADTATAVDEIVVTALRRSTSLQKVPASITAVTGETLQNMGISDSFQLSRIAPGLVIREAANGGGRVTIRNIQSAGESTVGLYYDETPVEGSPGLSTDAGGSMPDIRLFDVARAEVLRGPQGTLYGSSAMAGAVRLIFNKPNLSDWGGEVAAQGSDISGGGTGYQVQAMVNAPLIEDVLAVRVVGFHRDRDGYLDNSKLGKSDFNELTTTGGRAMIRFQPRENLTFDGLAVVQQTDTYNNNWYFPTYHSGGAAYDAAYDTFQPQYDSYRLFSGTMTWELDAFTVTGVVSKSNRRLAYTYDAGLQAYNLGRTATASNAQCRAYFSTGAANCSPAQVTQFRAFAAGRSPSTLYSPSESDAETQELRLTSNDRGGGLNWTVGLYHSTRDSRINSGIYAADPQTGLMRRPLARSPTEALKFQDPEYVYMLRTIEDKLEQTAAYGEATYAVTDRLSLTGGARYFKYEKMVGGNVLIGDPVSGTLPTDYRATTTDDTGWVFKFNAAFEATDNLMVYALASQGFRPGGVNQVVGLPAALEVYDSDSLWNYELGLKSSWFGRSLVFNADIFQIDWKDMQVRATTDADGGGNRYGYIANAGEVTVRGLEADLTWRPIEALSFNLSGSYINAELAKDQVTNGATISGAGLKGDTIPYTPEVTAQAGVEYVRRLTSDINFTARADLSYQSEAWSVFRRTNAFQQEIPAFSTVGARLGLESADGAWAASIYATNLTDELGLQVKAGGPLFGGNDNIRAVSIMPRVIGIDLRRSF